MPPLRGGRDLLYCSYPIRHKGMKALALVTEVSQDAGAVSPKHRLIDLYVGLSSNDLVQSGCNNSCAQL